MNLILISTSDAVQFNTEAWGRLGILYGIVILYTCLFIALGLLISAAVRESGVSLVVLLLIWVRLCGICTEYRWHLLGVERQYR